VSPYYSSSDVAKIEANVTPNDTIANRVYITNWCLVSDCTIPMMQTINDVRHSDIITAPIKLRTELILFILEFIKD
jgi:hypothetical protein